MDETQMFITGVLVAAAIMWPCFQWYTWYHRAVSASHEAQRAQDFITGTQSQFDAVASQLDAVNDERKLHHDTIQGVIDFVDEQSPFGSHDIEIKELRLKLLLVLNKSSVGRM